MNMNEMERLELERATERGAATPVNLITAEVAAKILGISRGAVYDLAAPKGPIPCVRLGRRCIRFNKEDVEAHVKKCLHTLISVTLAGDMISTKSLTVSAFEKQSYFQKRGIATRPKLSPSKKTQSSSPLQLVRKNREN